MKPTFRRLLILFILVAYPEHSFAHLGEEHPIGMHDYFPDFSVTQHNVEITDVFCINAAADVQELPDASGRFLALRTFNRLYMVQPDGSSNTFSQVSVNDTAGIQGSLSFELHPDFAIPGSDGFGKLYVITAGQDLSQEADFVSRGGGSHQYVLQELTVTDLSANVFSGSKRELMRFETFGLFHQVNDLVFGKDQTLYLSIGEDNGRSQAPLNDSVFGKVLRIDPLGTNSANGKYGIPADNPFVDVPSASPEVFATGFRNPFRLTFDEETDTLYAFDVGHLSIEEVDVVEAGEDYGWPVKEGSYLSPEDSTQDAVPDEPDPVSGLTTGQENGYKEPLFEFDHTDGMAVIGGLVYRGKEFPWLEGKVVFGGWSELSLGVETPSIFFGDPATGEVSILVESGRLTNNPTNFVADADGEILITGASCVHRLVSGRLPGDANDDGVVDAADLNALGLHWLQTEKAWKDGDFDGDGFVGTADLNILGLNWQTAAASVPEPAGISSFWLLLIVLLAKSRCTER